MEAVHDARERIRRAAEKGAQHERTGGLVAWRWSIQGLFVVGVASLVSVIRHTRGDEEAGRRELLGATVVGRQAPLVAALLVAGAANLLVAAAVAAGLTGLGLPVVGSVALGLSVAAAGCMVAALAGLAAQVSPSAGVARGIAGGAFALLYLMRAVGDVSGATDGPAWLAWLAWLSPVGWLRAVRPFAGEQWWVVGLFGGATAALCVLAFWLCRRRDLGQGLLPEPPGPAAAAPSLSSPVALAWRLQRGMLLAWTATFAVVGIAFGYVARTVADLLGLNPGLLAFFTSISGHAPPSDVVFHLYFLTFGPLVAIYAILARVRDRGFRARAPIRQRTGLCHLPVCPRAERPSRGAGRDHSAHRVVHPRGAPGDRRSARLRIS
jgi:ABC-2 type transport system permease protein